MLLNSAIEHHPSPATPGMPPRFSFLTMAEQSIGRRLDVLLQNEEGTRAGDDIAALHDMRVASRRLREAFRIFAPLFSKKRLKAVNSTARRITKALGTVREVDVNLEQLKRWKENPGSIHPLTVESLLAFELERQRRRRLRMQTRLDEISLGEFRDDVLNMVQHAQWKSRRSDGTAVPQTVLSPVSFAGPHVEAGLKSTLTALERTAAHPTLRNIHQLRIDTKKFRYTVELLSRAFKPGRATRIARQLKRLQDELGILHDAAVLYHRLRELRTELRPNQLDHLDKEMLRFMRLIAHEQAERTLRLKRSLARLERRQFFPRIHADLRTPATPPTTPFSSVSTS